MGRAESNDHQLDSASDLMDGLHLDQGSEVNLQQPLQPAKIKKSSGFKVFQDPADTEAAPADGLAKTFADSLNLRDDRENMPPPIKCDDAAKKARREERANRTRKINIIDEKHIKNETKTIQLNMDSPEQSKRKRKRSMARQDATVTITTKEAMDEIYGIFSQPLQSSIQPTVEESDDESDDVSTADGESTGTGNVSAPASEYGDETKKELFGDEATIEHAQLSLPYDSENMEPLDVACLAQPDAVDDNVEEDLLLPGEENYQTQTVPVSQEDHGSSSYGPSFGIIPNHRLPFMTPIPEATESSLATNTIYREKELLSAKTPSRQVGPTASLIDDDALMSSPFQEVTVGLEDMKQRVLQPIRTKSTKGTLVLGQGAANTQVQPQPCNVEDGAPLVQELQCNPMDSSIRTTILSQLTQRLLSFSGMHCHDRQNDRSNEIKRWARSVAKATKITSSVDKTVALPNPTISFEGVDTKYNFKRELGAGTFAPVYLVETDLRADGVSKERRHLEAIKMEDPPSVWEFFILNDIREKLATSRSIQSIVRPYEMHVFSDECYMVEEYRDQGTLLDLVNICRGEHNNSAGMDEVLAMWLTIELLRTIEDLHAKKLIHGDLKCDNMMVRFDDAGDETDWSATYFPSGAHGWSSKGLCLIDFGRGIDMTHFRPDVAFVADWKTTEADCSEMRELRPWTYQIDYYGLAGTIHSMLFGKYMETISEKSGLLGQGASKTYRIRESLKRYWQTEMWSELFHLLLNPTQHVQEEAGQSMPVVNGMRRCREQMQDWLAENCEKSTGLKSMILKLEGTLREKKRRAKSMA